MLLIRKTESTPEAIARDAALVSERRRRKALRLKKPQDRANSLAAELLAREALEAFGLSPELLCFDAAGRPFVREDAVFLSLSHSGEYAVCAVSDRPVGVDVQRIRPVSPRVIARVCTAREREQLESAADPQAVFARLWALKEAWRKANPDAALAQMLRAEFSHSPAGEIEGLAGFCYTLSDGPEGYALALCEAR